MKFAVVGRGDEAASAIIEGDEARIVGGWRTGPLLSADIAWDAGETGERVALADVRLLAPIGLDAKIVCLGLNYADHLAEVGRDMPPNPALFIKAHDVLVGPDMPVIRPKASVQFDFEGEIAVVIGRGGRHIAREQALDHVFGYTILMDGSVRDYQNHSAAAGKNFWHSGAIGPWIVTADEIPDPRRMTLETRLNGEVMQATSADLMLYDIPTAIAYISQWTMLRPGDVISTGTCAGVGLQRDPQLWMRAGDRLEIEVTPIGVLRNPVRDEADLEETVA